jgi:hypothetical protein
MTATVAAQTECLTTTGEVRSRIGHDSTGSPAEELWQPVYELCAPFDVELAECLAKVVFDRVRADEQLSGDLSVGATFRREASDVRLLRSELVSGVPGASPGVPTRRLQLAVCALGERLHAEVVEHLVSDPQLLASVRVTTLTSEPLAVKEMRARASSGRSRVRPSRSIASR